MACFCSDKKKLDYDYVRKLANAEAITKKVDIQIYFTIGYDGKTKYYDYEESNGGRRLQVVEVIRFSEPESLDILPNIEFTGFESIGQEVPEGYYKSGSGKLYKVRKSANKDSGTVL